MNVWICANKTNFRLAMAPKTHFTVKIHSRGQFLWLRIDNFAALAISHTHPHSQMAIARSEHNGQNIAITLFVRVSYHF